MKLKNDKWRKRRGGHARLLKIYCGDCNAFIFHYQKDGPGILKRLYLDRIIQPHTHTKPFSGHPFVCSKCKVLLGVPTIYKKEKRPAIQLFAGAVMKKVTRV